MRNNNAWKIIRFVIYVLTFTFYIYLNSGIGFYGLFHYGFAWVFNPTFFLAMLIEVGYFFNKTIPQFLQSTQFLEKIEEKSRMGMFFLNLGGTIITLFSAFWAQFEDWAILYLLALSSILYIFISKVISSWNFPIRDWFQSTFDGVFYNFVLFFLCANIVILTGLIYKILTDFDEYIFPFLILLVWMMFWFFWSFFDNFAKEYELRFRRYFFTQSKDMEAICSHCHMPLTEVMIHALALSDIVFCIHCGGKILKNEIFSPPEKEILREHNEIIQKLQDSKYQETVNSFEMPTKNSQ